MRSKKKSSSARKNASKVKFQKAGFVDMGRRAFRLGNGVLVTNVTGDERACVPDALCVLIPSFGISIPVKELQSIMSADTKEDTLFTTANSFVKNYGPIYELQGWTRFWLASSHGSLLCGQLRVTKGNHDKKLDFHCVA